MSAERNSRPPIPRWLNNRWGAAAIGAVAYLFAFAAWAALALAIASLLVGDALFFCLDILANLPRESLDGGVVFFHRPSGRRAPQ